MTGKWRLEDYGVSATHGFLPSEPPLQRLPTYYEPWEMICANLYTLRVKDQLACEVAKLPALSTKELVNEPQWRRAYVLLGFITNAYIWGASKPIEILPTSIAVPFVTVSEHLQVPPVTTYAAQNLWNFKPLDPRQSIENPDNFHALTTFTDSIDESWFFALPAAIEARGAPIIPLTLEAFDAASRNKPEQVESCLQEICTHTDALAVLLPRLYEKCNPSVFYNDIRPFLSGTSSTELLKGVFYEQKDGTGSHRVYQGPTAAQSSLFHFLDIALGVRYRQTEGSLNGDDPQSIAVGKEEEFLKKMRQHMPGGHRRFLEEVTKTANIRHYVTSHPEHLALQKAYNSCLDKLVLYRNKHLQIISRYILLPSRAASQGKALPQSEPGTAGRIPSTDGGSSEQKALGTGGTAPMEFLKQVRDETRESIL